MKAVTTFLVACLVGAIGVFLCARLLASSISSEPPLGELWTPVAFVALAIVIVTATCTAFVGLVMTIRLIARRLAFGRDRPGPAARRHGSA